MLHTQGTPLLTYIIPRPTPERRLFGARLSRTNQATVAGRRPSTVATSMSAHSAASRPRTGGLAGRQLALDELAAGPPGGSQRLGGGPRAQNGPESLAAPAGPRGRAGRRTALRVALSAGGGESRCTILGGWRRWDFRRWRQAGLSYAGRRRSAGELVAGGSASAIDSAPVALSPVLQRPAGIPELAAIDVAAPISSPPVCAAPIAGWVALGGELVDGELAAAGEGGVVGAEHHQAAGEPVAAQHALVIEAADRAWADELVAAPLALVAGEAQAATRLVSRLAADLALVSRET